MKKLLLSFILFSSINTFAIGSFTTIESGVTIYSEYHPNPKAKFKGTIVFENGAGSDITEWTQNQQFFNCVKQIGSVFVYDRNGLGKSPPDLRLSKSNLLTGKFVSDKLIKLLKQNNINPPYIFVAHSYGGMYAGYFVLKYPSLVSGFLMIDPVPKNFNFSNKTISIYESGIIVAKNYPPSYIYKKFNGSDAEAYYEFIGFETAKQEVSYLGNINKNIPVIIISSNKMEKNNPLQQDWYNSQKQWLNSNNKSRIFTVNTGHFVQLEQPQVVCGAIKELVNIHK